MENWNNDLPKKEGWFLVCYEFLCNDADGLSMNIAYYDGKEWSIGNKHKPYAKNGKVTHWMCLPPFPSVGKI
jgi:hypothetical protein